MRKGTRKAAILLSVALLSTLSLSLAACNETVDPTGTPTDAPGEGKYFTVTLDPNGGVFADGSTEKKEIQVRENGKINFSEYGVTYEGNEMYGWYYTDGTPFPAARKVKENITIKAKWSAAQEVVRIGMSLHDYVNNEVSVDYDDGVYQFFKNSPIYGGYAQRGGKYTVYEEELKNALQENKDSEKAVCVYTAKSNYKDSTGGCFAEFFNDGTAELIYQFTNDGETTKYTMEVLAYTLEGVTMPFAAPKLPDISGTAMDGEGNVNPEALASKSVHYKDNEEALKGGPGTLENPFETDDPHEGEFVLSEKVEVEDETVFARYGANNGSKTMFLQFNKDGTYAVKMNYGNYGLVDVGKKGTWGVQDGKLAFEGDGTFTVKEDNVTVVYEDGNGNTYAFLTTDFLPPLSAVVDTSEDETITVRYAANNGSKTLFLQFNKDGTYNVKMNYGNYGLVDVGCNGTWKVVEGKLEMTGGGTLVEQFGVYGFTDSNNNTYAFELTFGNEE